MKKTSLVIMAAGLGSRFGGTKQLANIGPNEEAILDYTIRDAQAAGIEDIVLIVRTEIATDIEAHIENIHGSDHNCTFVCQDDFGPHREKPWGTTHAVLSAEHSITEGSSFLLANADDYYGPASFELASNQLPLLNPGVGMLITFELAKTLPQSGEVTRGICNVKNGHLTEILETTSIGLRSNGEITEGRGFCIENNQGADFLNLDINNNFEKWYTPFFTKFSTDKSDFNCQIPQIKHEFNF